LFTCWRTKKEADRKIKSRSKQSVLSRLSYIIKHDDKKEKLIENKLRGKAEKIIEISLKLAGMLFLNKIWRGVGLLLKDKESSIVKKVLMN
jgi:hypothetical protein